MSGLDSEHVILTEKLTKTYGRNRGIAGLDLDVHRGEVFGFLGPNGAGKTTTIRTMLDLLHPTSGRALLLGMDSRRDSVAIRARLGNLPGEFALEDRMTGEDLLRFFGRLRGTTDMSYARALAERLDADLTRPMRHLSRGNKQKIGLIQAMFHSSGSAHPGRTHGWSGPAGAGGVREADGRVAHRGTHRVPLFTRTQRGGARMRPGGHHSRGGAGGSGDHRVSISKRFRRMTLTFAQPVDPAPFAALPGTERRALGRQHGLSGCAVRPGQRHQADGAEHARGPGLRAPQLGGGLPHLLWELPRRLAVGFAGRWVWGRQRGRRGRCAVSRLWAQVRELLRGQTRNILVWGFSMGLLGAMYMALFPSMGQLVQGYP